MAMFDGTHRREEGYDPAMTAGSAFDPRQQDAMLIRAVADGDRAAARSLIDTHLSALIAHVERLTRDRSEAEDIAQESFLRLWRIAGDWTPRAKARTWLTTVASRLAIDRLRRAKRWSDAELPEVEDTRPSPEARADAREVGQAVEEAIQALPDRQRAAFALVHLDGLSGRDAADSLGVSEEALESLLARARRSLRARLADYRMEERPS